MRNNIIKIAYYGLERINRMKHKDLEEMDLIKLKKIAEDFNISSGKRHDAEFVLGLYGAREMLNYAQDQSQYNSKNTIKILEEIWRE